ncbi:MAG: MotA/TolQ/ExbB proton channel family protein, partial [Myxococcales bacterium]|nr:MotA/TolQ/ExbB proton channel family protein [Myxococcales bacterium]
MSNLWHHFQEGGKMMWVILLFLVIAVGVIIERAVYLFRSSIDRDVFLATMQKCILAGDVGRAIK